MSWKLKRTKQCKKCPWKTTTNPRDIPNGYCETKHKNIKSTIAVEGDLSTIISGNMVMRAMACHEADDAHCIGWLANQLGSGNNIAMRVRMVFCDNRDKIKTVGKQHEIFEDTLPS